MLLFMMTLKWIEDWSQRHEFSQGQPLVGSLNWELPYKGV